MSDEIKINPEEELEKEFIKTALYWENAVSKDLRELPKLSLLLKGSVWAHKKRGTVYEVSELAIMQAEESKLDMKAAALYRSAEEPQRAWVRPLAEFMDGRFSLVQLTSKNTSAYSWLRPSA